MPSDADAHRSSQPKLIRTPDQLQQAKRPDASPPGEDSDGRREPVEASPRREGILGQLDTERAHD